MNTEKRTMIAIYPSTRIRVKRLSAILGAVEERKMSQDDTLNWLFDRYENEIARRFAMSAMQAEEAKEHA